jgi:hypothetical protein
MDQENPFPRLLRRALTGLGLFLAGALLAFGYSYRPLHGALSWQVDQLESRLDERNRENVRLSDALAKQNSIEATQIAPETLAQVERELEQTKRVLDQAEKDLKRAERKRRESTASAAKWRSRFEELRDTSAPMIVEVSDSMESDRAATPLLDSNSKGPAAPASDPPWTPSTDRSQAPAERGMLLQD